jgi:phosphonate transport system substrate-binding protein
MKRLLFLVLFSLLQLDARVINFSPLPMDKAPKLLLQYTPLLKYLSEQTGDKYNFVFSESYDTIIKDFQEGKLDIIELGPLPFVKLSQKYKYAKPFLTFLTKDGMDSYTCEMLTTEKSIKSLADVDEKIHVNLTRRISTCGYLMSEFILRNNGQSLKNLDYEYVGTHSSVLLHILLEDMAIGTAKSTIVEKYKQFKFTHLASSPKIPGFAFVANLKTIDQESIKKIQQAMLKLKPLENAKDAQFTKTWGENVKYGCVATGEKTYEEIFNALSIIEIPKDEASR